MKNTIRKVTVSVIASTAIALSACSMNDVQVEKIYNESSAFQNNASDFSMQEGSSSDLPETAALGETLFAENLVMNGGSGTINWSIDKAEVYETMQDAGLQLDDMFADEFADGVNWDSTKETFTDNRVLVMLHITIENVDAVSREHAEDPEKYDKYDFRVDALGSCSYGPLMYFSKMGECSVHLCAFHLEPGESTKIAAGYLVDLRNVSLKDVTFNTAATPKNGTIINLNLG